MRVKTIQHYESEIKNLLLEVGVKENEIEHYLDVFDMPEQWIHVFKEWLDDQDGEKRL